MDAFEMAIDSARIHAELAEKEAVAACSRATENDEQGAVMSAQRATLETRLCMTAVDMAKAIATMDDERQQVADAKKMLERVEKTTQGARKAADEAVEKGIRKAERELLDELYGAL